MARGISNRKIDVAMQLVAALNTRSSRRVSELITPDCRFIDNTGGTIEGAQAIGAATERFFELDPSFRLEITGKTVRGDDALLSGHSRSNEPSLNHDTLWRAKVRGRKISEFQSYGTQPVRLSQILAQPRQLST